MTDVHPKYWVCYQTLLDLVPAMARAFPDLPRAQIEDLVESICQSVCKTMASDKTIDSLRGYLRISFRNKVRSELKKLQKERKSARHVSFDDWQERIDSAEEGWIGDVTELAPAATPEDPDLERATQGYGTPSEEASPEERSLLSTRFRAALTGVANASYKALLQHWLHDAEGAQRAWVHDRLTREIDGGEPERSDTSTRIKRRSTINNTFTQTKKRARIALWKVVVRNNRDVFDHAPTGVIDALTGRKSPVSRQHAENWFRLVLADPVALGVPVRGAS